MFKLAVFAAVLAIAYAAPGGLTGLVVRTEKHGIAAPAVWSAAPLLSHGAHVIAQPVAPVVHSPAVVTKTVWNGHGLAGNWAGNGWAGNGWAGNWNGHGLAGNWNGAWLGKGLAW